MGLVNSGSLRPIRTSIRGPRGSSDGFIEQLVAGDHYAANHGGLGISPDMYIPDSEAARRNTWFYREGELNLVTQASTTDGNSEFFTLLTNSGTSTLLGTVAGYEGKVLSTTGATSGNQNHYIACPSFLSVANQIAVMRCQIYMPDPATSTGYDFVFGFGNKQADPIGTAFTDGAWVQGVTAANNCVIVGKTRTNTGTATTTATVATIASGVPRSIELAIVMLGQANYQFWTRDPTLAANLWTHIDTALTPPRNTIQMRPHLVLYTRGALARPFSIGKYSYQWLRPTTL